MKITSSSLLLAASAVVQSSPLFELLGDVHYLSTPSVGAADNSAQRYLLTPVNKIGPPGRELFTDPRSRLSNGLTRVCSVWVVRTGSTTWLPARIETADADDLSRKGPAVKYFYPDRGTPPIDLVNECEKKGRTIYAEVLRTRSADKTWSSLKDKFDTKLEGIFEANPLSWKKIGVEGLQYQAPFQVQQIATKNLRKDATVYKASFNATIGVIIGEENYSVADENIPKFPWSEVVYQEYLDVANKERKSLRNLKYVVQQNIVSSETLYVMQQVIARKTNKDETEARWYSFKNSNGDFTKVNPDKLQFPGARETYFQIRHATHEKLFLALLGTDHGNGIGYLLADHGLAIDKKRIARFVIHDRSLIGEYE
jgi:hypothetical protein